MSLNWAGINNIRTASMMFIVGVSYNIPRIMAELGQGLSLFSVWPDAPRYRLRFA